MSTKNMIKSNNYMKKITENLIVKIYHFIIQTAIKFVLKFLGKKVKNF